MSPFVETATDASLQLCSRRYDGAARAGWGFAASWVTQHSSRRIVPIETWHQM
jgi:hypothetical protein